MGKLTTPDQQALRAYIEDIYLEGVSLERTRGGFHTYLQNQIAALANEFYLIPIKEYALWYLDGNRRGHIDVVWAIGSTPVVAIEIDSARREKSIRKLLALDSNLLIWIYYGIHPIDPFVGSVDETRKVKVIHFPTRFARQKAVPQRAPLVEFDRTELRTSKSYGFADVRLKYPNAYEKWSNEHEKVLKEMRAKGLSIDEIAKKLQRNPGGIRARIKKMELPY